MNSTPKLQSSASATILSGCIPYDVLKDEVVDSLYNKAFEITSEKEYLASCGFNSSEIQKWAQRRANQGLKKRIAQALKNYDNPREEFLSSFENVSVKGIWRNNKLFFKVLYSPFLSKKSNDAVEGFDGLGFLDDNNPGQATAFTVPKNWLIPL